MNAASQPPSTQAKVIARALGGVQQNAHHWLAPCPVRTHGKGQGDRNPSLSVRTSSRGTVIVHCFAGCEAKDVVAALKARGLWCDSPSGDSERHRTQSNEPDAKPAEDKARRTARALMVWRASFAAQGTLVETYLNSRGITYPPPPTLRFHPRLWHAPSRLQWPAMVAIVTDGISNTPLGIHRTFLARDGCGKAPVEQVKMMLGPTRGGMVRLAAFDERVQIGEGIETCLSALQETRRATTAALSTSGLRTLNLPAGVREVVVIADGDDPGEAAAKHAAHRWRREGRRVSIARAPRGFDFNDVLMGSASQFPESHRG